MRTFGEAPPPPTFFERLKAGLSRSTAGLSDGLIGVIAGKKLDAATIEELEDALIGADLGPAQAARIAGEIAKGRHDAMISDFDLRRLLCREIEKVLAPAAKPLVVDGGKKPFVILVAGVNGTGKTTTIGKIAKRFRDEGAKVVLAAGDTFRAAAIEQLQVWGGRAGADVMASAPGALGFNRLFIKYVFAHAFQLTDDGWRQLTWRWGIFFFALAVLNEIVWRNFSTDSWVIFKVWIIIPLIFLFALTQSAFVLKHQLPGTGQKS